MDAIVPGQVLEDGSGHEIGRVTDVLSDPVSLQAKWLAVRVGRFGGEHLVPLRAVTDLDGRLVANLRKEQVKAAPKVKAHAAPSKHESLKLLQHYGLTST